MIFLLCLGSCATTTLTNVWKEKDYQSWPFDKIFVLVALQDPSLRRFSEDKIVSLLGLNGIQSVASYTILQNYGISDKESIASAIKESETDSFLIMRFIKIEIGDTYASEKKYTIPTWYHDWYTYYSRSFGHMQTPKYNDQNFFAVIETNMYYVKTETLIWSARSEILMVACGCEEIGSYIEDIIDKLISDQLIK